MILTQKTCGQRSSRAAGSLSKRRALENYFPERICCMFRLSKCRGDWNLGRYMFGVQKENCCAMATSEKKRVSPAGKLEIEFFFLSELWECTWVWVLEWQPLSTTNNKTKQGEWRPRFWSSSTEPSCQQNKLTHLWFACSCHGGSPVTPLCLLNTTQDRARHKW